MNLGGSRVNAQNVTADSFPSPRTKPWKRLFTAADLDVNLIRVFYDSGTTSKRTTHRAKSPGVTDSGADNEQTLPMGCTDRIGLRRTRNRSSFQEVAFEKGGLVC